MATMVACARCDQPVGDFEDEYGWCRACAREMCAGGWHAPVGERLPLRYDRSVYMAPAADTWVTTGRSVVRAERLRVALHEDGQLHLSGELMYQTKKAKAEERIFPIRSMSAADARALMSLLERAVADRDVQSNGTYGSSPGVTR